MQCEHTRNVLERNVDIQFISDNLIYSFFITIEYYSKVSSLPEIKCIECKHTLPEIICMYL